MKFKFIFVHELEKLLIVYLVIIQFNEWFTNNRTWDCLRCLKNHFCKIRDLKFKTDSRKRNDSDECLQSADNYLPVITCWLKRKWKLVTIQFRKQSRQSFYLGISSSVRRRKAYLTDKRLQAALQTWWL